MVDVQTTLAIIFVVVMSVLLYYYRKNLQTQFILGPFLYFCMLKTTLGLTAMDWLGTRFRRTFRILGYVGVVLGFIGMALITYSLIKSTVMLFMNPAAAPGIQPVLPFQAKGVFFVPFSYWVISIFVIAVLHEFAHGVLARANAIGVKSSGFAFLGALVPVIPAAFVEPDEQQLSKKSVWAQLSVFAAGPAANVLTAFLLVFAFGISVEPLIPASWTEKTAIVDITELGTSLITFSGLTINRIDPGSPGELAGLRVGQTITSFNGISVADREYTLNTIDTLKPNEPLIVGVGEEGHTVILGASPDNPERGFIGVGFDTETKFADAAVARYGNAGVQIILFFISLIVWIFLLSLGIGLFNLVPLGPIDGGRMLKLALERLTGSLDSGSRIWKAVSIGILGMIVVNLVVGFIR